MDTLTKECARCGTVFDIDEIYKKIYVETWEHPEDVAAGSTRPDKEYTVCGPCSVRFEVWLDPEVDSVDEFLDMDPSKLFGPSDDEVETAE